MKLPDNFDHVAVLDAVLTDLLAVRNIDYPTLNQEQKYRLRNSLMPTLNALAPHILAVLVASQEQAAADSFTVPDTLEGLVP